jgi:protein-disulfide isomerase-like protein with CxxC motif
MTGPDGGMAASEDFSLARALGATAFPTLLVVSDGYVSPLPRIGASVQMLTRHLDAALSARASS